MFCRNCGASLPDGSVFCSSCGQDLRAQSQPPAYQSKPVQTPGVYQTPGYQMPPVQYKPKRRNTGLIVLVCVLAVVVLAAVIVICVLVASPKDTPAAVSSTPKISASPTPTAAPTESAPATETPAPAITGTISGFPYDFVQLNYPEATFMPKSFGSMEEFETELAAAAWNYYEALSNKDAVSFNGGYVDIGYNDTAQIIHQYVFNSDYTLKNFQLNATDYTVANEYSNSYWTQASGDIYIACYNLGVNTELNGVTYKTAVAVFINENGDLVEYMALYDPYNNVFVPISNYDIYQKSLTPPSNTNNTNGEETQKAFGSALQSSVWTYSSTENAAPEMDIEQYSNIMPENPYKLVFSPDMTLEFLDINTGETMSDEALDYVFGKNHAYVTIDQYVQGGVTYEIDLYYFIDANGSLEEQMMAYDSASGTYYALSNINVYTGVTP